LEPPSKKFRHHTGRSPVDLLFSLPPPATPVEARLVSLLCSRHTGRSPVGTSPGLSFNLGWKLPSLIYLSTGMRTKARHTPGTSISQLYVG